MHFINVAPSMQIARNFFELKRDFLTTSTRVMEIEYDPKWLISTHILIRQYIYWSLTAFFHGKVTPTKFPRHMVRFLDLSAKSRHGT